MERDIKSIGLYRAKSKNLILCAKRLAEVYDGKVPSDIDELTTLAGVGRKTANVIRGNIYNIPSIIVGAARGVRARQAARRPGAP